MLEIKNPKNIELPLENCKICGTPTNPYDMAVVPPCSKICNKCYSAFYEEASRIAYENAEKEAKENGNIRVKLDLPKPPRTNFDRITESEQAFVKWVLDNYYSVPKFFPCETKCNGDCEECFIEWLNKEIEE